MGNKFAGGDPEYLRKQQYGSPEHLAARQQLHARYSTAPSPWFAWMAATIPWQPGIVLEVGCGPGQFWEEGRPPTDGPVVLTDASEGMVVAAVERARRFGFRVEGRVAAAQSVPMTDGVAAHVIANHMLYHVPRPADAVAEMARVVRDDGVVSVATNGREHMAELKRLEHEVFGTAVGDSTVDAFGLESGLPMLAASFEEVQLRRFEDSLRPTDPQHVVDYLTSYPPGEDASPAQHRQLVDLVSSRFDDGDGVFTVTKDTGLFICRGPRRR